MGFSGSIDLMVTDAIATAAAFFSDFWPFVAFMVGLLALGYIITLFIHR